MIAEKGRDGAGPPVRRASGAAARRNRTGWVFVTPFLVAFALAVIAPVVYAVYLSLFRQQMVGGTVFVGADNYVKALQDAKLWESAGRVFLFLVIQVPIMLCLSGLAAMAIDSGRLAGARIFRIGIFLPYAVPGVVATLMWGFMYGDQFGLVSSINDGLGWSIPAPLSARWVLVAIGNIVTWEFVGYNMLILYSALRVIPADLYEAAALDGAGAWRIVRSIKLPALRPALVVATVFSIIGSLQLFNEPNILSNLVPNIVSSYYTPNLYAYTLAFSGRQYNYAGAVAIVMGLVTVVFAGVTQVRAMRGESK